MDICEACHLDLQVNCELHQKEGSPAAFGEIRCLLLKMNVPQLSTGYSKLDLRFRNGREKCSAQVCDSSAFLQDRSCVSSLSRFLRYWRSVRIRLPPEISSKRALIWPEVRPPRDPKPGDDRNWPYSYFRQQFIIAGMESCAGKSDARKLSLG